MVADPKHFRSGCASATVDFVGRWERENNVQIICIFKN